MELYYYYPSIFSFISFLQLTSSNDLFAGDPKFKDWGYVKIGPDYFPESNPQPLLLNLKGNTDEAASDLKCGHSYLNASDGDTGIIESPNYPESYPAGLECTWIIEAREGHSVHMGIFDFRTAKSSAGKSADSLYVKLGDNEQPRKYSGDLNSVTPISLVSHSNQIVLRFKASESSYGYTGFRMVYYVTRAKKPNGQQQQQQPAGQQNINTAISSACQTTVPGQQPPGMNQNNPGAQVGGSRDWTEMRQKLLREWDEMMALGRTSGDPFLVGLITDHEYFCSGTLIRNDFVVTSAHCTSGVTHVRMVFGTDDLTISDVAVQERKAGPEDIIQHPYFDSTTGLNDISLIRISPPVRISPYVKPLILPQWSALAETFAGTQSRVSGWGHTENGAGVQMKSGSSDLSIASNTECRRDVYGAINGLMMCSRGVVSRNSTTRSQIDSGSPVTARCGNQGGQGTTIVHCPGICIINAGCHRDAYLGHHGIGSTGRVETPDTDSKKKPNTTPRPGGLPGFNVPGGGCNSIGRSGNILLGFVSFGSLEKGLVYTRITAHFDFLKEHMGA